MCSTPKPVANVTKHGAASITAVPVTPAAAAVIPAEPKRRILASGEYCPGGSPLEVLNKSADFEKLRNKLTT